MSCILMSFKPQFFNFNTLRLSCGNNITTSCSTPWGKSKHVLGLKHIHLQHEGLIALKEQCQKAMTPLWSDNTNHQTTDKSNMLVQNLQWRGSGSHWDAATASRLSEGCDSVCCMISLANSSWFAKIAAMALRCREVHCSVWPSTLEFTHAPQQLRNCGVFAQRMQSRLVHLLTWTKCRGSAVATGSRDTIVKEEVNAWETASANLQTRMSRDDTWLEHANYLNNSVGEEQEIEIWDNIQINIQRQSFCTI